MVRAFDGPEIVHTEGSVDSVRDLEIVASELRFKDFEYALKHMEVVEKKARSTVKTKQVKDELATAEKVLSVLDSERRVADAVWTADEAAVINGMALLTAKPCVYVANVGEDEYVEFHMSGRDFGSNARLAQIRAWLDEHSPGAVLLPVAVGLESRLNGMESEEERREELELLEVPSALPEAVTELRKALNLISYYTAGPEEVREWTIRKVCLLITNSPYPHVCTNLSRAQRHQRPRPQFTQTWPRRLSRPR